MSIDWNVVCDKCRQWHHLGQDSGGTCSFGYGSNDESGRDTVGRFIADHMNHNWGDGESLRVVKTDNFPDGYTSAICEHVNEISKEVKTSAIYCEHANEMPVICPCPDDCYCKDHSCKGR